MVYRKFTPPQLAENPNNANAKWLTNHRLSVYMIGADPVGNTIIAYTVDVELMQDNVWQDFEDGMNHSRAEWVPKNNYWLANNLSPRQKMVTLVHETKEDRVLGGSSTQKTYDDAHTYEANPLEFEARHGDTLKVLRDLGWRC
jgi:hypothetical protein